MSKSKEIKKYIKEKNIHTKSSINKLIDEGRIIYGDFINKEIFKNSNTKMPKAGILIIEDKKLYFYGAKSILEKEVFCSFQYENIKVTSTPTFTINFIIELPNKSYDKCKLSISWEDYISKNIKQLFLSSLKNKIIKSLKRKASKLLKQQNINNSEVYFYFKKLLDNKLYEKKLIKGYLSLTKREILDKNNLSSSEFDFSDILDQKKEYLYNLFPQQKDIITNSLSKFKKDVWENKNFITDIDNSGKNIERRKIYRNKVDVKSIIEEEQIIQILSDPKVKNSIEKKIKTQIQKIKGEILDSYNGKLQSYADQFEIEKNVYKEIIKDNILLSKEINLKDEVSDSIIETITQFYSRNKILENKLPESFSIDKLKPNDGVQKFIKIMDFLPLKYIKVIDPYFFSDELNYFESIPQHINIQILTSAIMSSEYKSNLTEFKNKLEKIRKRRIGNFQVKIIKYKNKNGTPLHDRAIFSEDWAISLSNSLSQIGAKYDILFNRIYDHKDREEIGFNDFWFMNNEVGKKGKVKQLFITDL